MRAMERLPYLVALVIALILLRQAFMLESWTFMGPGPGLFPQLTTAVAAAIALVLTCFPGLAAGQSQATAEAEPILDTEDRRRVAIYVLALPFLALGSALLGFVVTSVSLVLALTWQAERRRWLHAMTFGAICGLVGLLGFGRLLGASLPETIVEQSLLGLLR